MSTDKKFDFLKFAIEDAQGLIKYIDTKTAIAITIIGAFVVGIFSIIEKIVKYYSNYNWLFWILLSVFIVFLLLCVRITARIIKPTTNPTKNINLNGEPVPDVKFFLAVNKYTGKYTSRDHIVKNSDDHKLDYTYKKYMEDLANADDSKLEAVLAYELLKVSYIRNVKNDRFNKLVNLLIFSSLLFTAFYLLYTIETESITRKTEKNAREKVIQVINQKNTIENHQLPPKIIYRKRRDTARQCTCCK